MTKVNRKEVIIKRRTIFQRPTEREAATLHVLVKYMQAFISQEGPWSLTAGVSLAERHSLSNTILLCRVGSGDDDYYAITTTSVVAGTRRLRTRVEPESP